MPKRKRKEKDHVDLDSKEILDDHFEVIADESDFEINRFGQIRNRKRGNLRKHYIDANGYRTIVLKTHGKTYLVHRLVAVAFIPNLDSRLDIVDHKNSDRADCRADNLEWVTSKTNSQRAHRHRTPKMWSESQKYNKVPVRQVDSKTGTLIKTFSSLSDAARATNTTPRSIQHLMVAEATIDGTFRWETGEKLVKPNSEIEGEKWLPVPGWPGYEASDLGRIRGKRQNLLSLQIISGYHHVQLINGAERKNAYVHRLVALAFLGPPSDPKLVVDHKDGNRLNNISANLRWISHKENVELALATKVHKINPTSMEILATFNSINAACHAAGIEKNAFRKILHESKLSDGFIWKRA